MELLQSCTNVVFVLYFLLPDDSRRNALPRFCYDPRSILEERVFFDGSLYFLIGSADVRPLKRRPDSLLIGSRPGDD